MWADHGKRPGPQPKPKCRKVCTFDPCDRHVHSNGLCSSHDMQCRRGGELRPIRPPKPASEEGLLWCSSCKQFVDESEFGWDTKRDQPKRGCRPCNNDRQRAYTERNRDSVNLQRRLRVRGITEQQYRELLEQQDGRCAICKKQRQLDIDHCHTSGRVRSLLCGPCNRGLGFFQDDPEIMARALEYISHHNKRLGA